jgi:hypothetical protein
MKNVATMSMVGYKHVTWLAINMSKVDKTKCNNTQNPSPKSAKINK